MVVYDPIEGVLLIIALGGALGLIVYSICLIRYYVRENAKLKSRVARLRRRLEEEEELYGEALAGVCGSLVKEDWETPTAELLDSSDFQIPVLEECIHLPSLKAHRYLRGWSVFELSEKAGVSVDVLTRLELGAYYISPDTAAKIAEALEVDLGILQAKRGGTNGVRSDDS